MVRKLSLSLVIAGLIGQLAINEGAAAGTTTATSTSAASSAPSSSSKAKQKSGKPSAKAAAPSLNKSSKVSGPTTPPGSASSSKDDPANTELAGGKKPRAEVLDPNQFFGMAMLGYAAAKAAPQVMENLFCYCGCDLTDSHVSLLDCFTSIHGVDCHICQEEAQIALKLHKQGMPMPKIQQRIDEEFTNQYPFEEDTPTYSKYKANRLWKKGSAKADEKPAEQVAPVKAATTTPKLKPGAKAGNCCGGKHKQP